MPELDNILYARIKVRGDTAANLTANNPTLLDREVVFETDGIPGPGSTTWRKFKIGPGQWSTLLYAGFGDPTTLSDTGTAAIAVHVAAVDPHGDRVYTDGAIAGEVVNRNAAIDAKLVGIYKAAGDWDPSTGTWPTIGNGPGNGVAQGDTYRCINAPGIIGSKSFDIGDTFYASIAAPGQTDTGWGRFEYNTEQATEGVRGTVRIVTDASVENPLSQNDVDAVTAKKWWKAFAVAIGIPAFFTAVRSAVLTGISFTNSTLVQATDTLLQAIGKLQAQTNRLRSEAISGYIQGAVGAGTYPLVQYATSAGTIDRLIMITETGTLSATIKIDGVTVTGMSSVAASSTEVSVSSSAYSAYAIGATISMVLAPGTTPVGLAFTLDCTRTL